ncbi:DinB family protein [Deinococcus ruber]|uniref:Damage-inducible protein DinB n=1 Tax=Deinococcus ruber TaxID=1848197 RepID=A0A918BUA1_9DEIO|nr:DinB family protein [Deinococcus ruber]GGQ92949.1 damage-inducible protein DinB [Deinococcus ruber]
MNIPETYDYLMRARRDLWAKLASVSDEVLARPLLGGERFHCIKDLVFHIAGTEDGWLHYTILEDEPVQHTLASVRDIPDGPFCADVPLDTLLDYWRAVEQSTLGYLAGLKDDDLKRLVYDSPTERYMLDGLLWHVLLHEVRHTAQIVMLLRMQDISPPALDLFFYLPSFPAAPEDNQHSAGTSSSEDSPT